MIVWKHAQFEKIQIYPVTEFLTFNFNVSVVNIAFLKYFAVFDYFFNFKIADVRCTSDVAN